MNLYIKKIKENYKINIDERILINILFEMNKYFDKKLTDEIQYKQKECGKIFNSSQRSLIRLYYYYKINSVLAKCGIDTFPTIQYSDYEITEVAMNTLNRLSKYDEKKIIGSIEKRFEEINSGDILKENEIEWLKWRQEKVSLESLYSCIILKLKQKDFSDNGYNIDYFLLKIRKSYSVLENYRHIIIVADEKIHDKKGNDLYWDCLFKIGIYLENFLQYKDDFFPFKKDKQIENLAKFIEKRTGFSQSLDQARQFYSSICYGFKFEDCYISDDASTTLMVYKKIQLDNRKVPCPSCMTTIQSGNSFPEIFLKSWECKNDCCPDRSKSGRGKRFDEFGIYRYFKMVENNPEDQISMFLYKAWKKDVFSKHCNWIEMVSKFYLWAGEKAGYNGFEIPNIYKSRFFEEIDFDDLIPSGNASEHFSNLPIVVFLKGVYKHLPQSVGTKELTKKLLVVNDNSSDFLNNLKESQIGGSVTSPPYYNAREYSQWPNLLMYLIDMMINAKAVFRCMTETGTYLYNIGDIVAEDNIYVVSNMSKKRLQLGFLSALIFDIVGFKVCGNIIWNKGEVQSKRNSTTNLCTGYVKCINCYEHVFVLRKNFGNDFYSKVVSFSPVIKINCKGENIYKHTAPYPQDLVELIRPFVTHDDYILDPFLGSGTTLVWCRENGYKGVGVELNKEYYQLCLSKLENKKGA